jgi:hypothetical protein
MEDNTIKLVTAIEGIANVAENADNSLSKFIKNAESGLKKLSNNIIKISEVIEMGDSLTNFEGEFVSSIINIVEQTKSLAPSFDKVKKSGGSFISFFNDAGNNIKKLEQSYAKFGENSKVFLNNAGWEIQKFVGKSANKFLEFKSAISNIASGAKGIFDKIASAPSEVIPKIMSSKIMQKIMSSEVMQKIVGEIDIIKKKVDEFKGRMLDFVSKTKGVFDKIIPDEVKQNIINKMDVIKTKVDKFKDVMSKVGTGAKEMFKQISPMLTQIAFGSKALLSQGTEAINGIVGKTTNALMSVMGVAIKMLGPGILLAGLIVGLSLLDGAMDGQISNLIEVAKTKGPEIITGIANGISSAIPALMETGTKLLVGFLDVLTINIPIILSSGMQIIQTLIAGLVLALPSLIPATIQMIGALIEAIITNAPLLLLAGLDLLQGLIDGIILSLPIFVETIAGLVETLGTTLTTQLPLIIEKGIEILVSLINGIVQAIPGLIPVVIQFIGVILESLIVSLPLILEGGIKILDALISGVIATIPLLPGMIVTVFKTLLTTIVTHLPTILEKGKEILLKIGSGIISAIPELLLLIPRVIGELTKAFTGVDWGEIGLNIISGIGKGITNAAGGLVEKAKTAANAALNGVKSFLGIHSPSRKFRDEVGRHIVPGISVGVENTKDGLQNTLNKVADNLTFETRLEEVIPKLNPTDDFSSNNSILEQGHSNNTYNNYMEQKVIDKLEILIHSFNKLCSNYPNYNVVLDDGVLVGKMAPKMNIALSEISNEEKRGRR